MAAQIQDSKLDLFRSLTIWAKLLVRSAAILTSGHACVIASTQATMTTSQMKTSRLLTKMLSNFVGTKSGAEQLDRRMSDW